MRQCWASGRCLVSCNWKPNQNPESKIQIQQLTNPTKTYQFSLEPRGLVAITSVTKDPKTQNPYRSRNSVLMEPTITALLWNSSSNTASGWLVDLFFILVLNQRRGPDKITLFFLSFYLSYFAICPTRWPIWPAAELMTMVSPALKRNVFDRGKI